MEAHLSMAAGTNTASRRDCEAGNKNTLYFPDEVL